MTASPSSSGSSWYLFKCEHRSPSASPGPAAPSAPAAGCDLNFLHTHFEWASCKVPSPLPRHCPSVRPSICPSKTSWRTDSEDNTAWHWLNQSSVSVSVPRALSQDPTPCQSALKSQNSRGKRWQVHGNKIECCFGLVRIKPTLINRQEKFAYMSSMINTKFSYPMMAIFYRSVSDMGRGGKYRWTTCRRSAFQILFSPHRTWYESLEVANGSRKKNCCRIAITHTERKMPQKKKMSNRQEYPNDK